METSPLASNSDESVSSSTGEGTAGHTLSQASMFRSLSDVFENVVPQETTGFGFDEWPKLFERAHSGFEMDKALQAVVSILQYMEQSSPVALVAATKVLADGSRYGKLLTDLQTVTRTTITTPS